jgi:acetylglutamate kinase
LKALIKIGGALLDTPDVREDLARQIATIVGLGWRITVVHGGGKQMTRFLEERGIKSSFVRGLRVTTDETIDAVLKVLAGSVNTQLAASLAAAGLRPVGLTGIDSGIATAEQLDPELGFVGKVVSSDPGLLETLTAAGYAPVVACVAGGKRGEVFNVNGDSMAVAVASGWAVDRLVFLTDVPGVLDADKKILPLLTAGQCDELIAKGVATGGMQAKLNAATSAVATGVREVRIVNGSHPNVLPEVFRGARIGTRIVREAESGAAL